MRLVHWRIAFPLSLSPRKKGKSRSYLRKINMRQVARAKIIPNNKRNNGILMVDVTSRKTHKTIETTYTYFSKMATSFFWLNFFPFHYTQSKWGLAVWQCNNPFPFFSVCKKLGKMSVGVRTMEVYGWYNEKKFTIRWEMSNYEWVQLIQYVLIGLLLVYLFR